MSYDVELTEVAERRRLGLSPWLQNILDDHLLKLGESPSGLSRTTVSPPYPPGGMMSEFDHGPVDGLIHHFAVFFRYSQDETKLIVQAIGHGEYRVD